jgi:hypothetical protein
MGQPSFAASNAVIYLAYGLFLYVYEGFVCGHGTFSVPDALYRFTAPNVIMTLSRVLGTGLAWRMRNNSKQEFLAGNKSQTGQTTGILPLARWVMLLCTAIGRTAAPLNTWYMLARWIRANTFSNTALPLAINFIAAGE